jgi:hypothetical protein
MENRNRRIPVVPQPAGRNRLHPYLVLAGIIVFVGAGCGAPGEPTPPSPTIPASITDLSARQLGDGTQLTFTMPEKTVHGDRLTETPAVEVLRGLLKPDGAPDTASFRVVETIPGSLVNKYLIDDHAQVTDLIPPEETRAHPGATLAYRVRTRVSRKRPSPDSNVVSVRIFPVAQRVVSIDAKVTETAIVLRWTAPARTSGGEPLADAPEQHVYRGEIDARTYDAGSRDISRVKWISPQTLLARTDTAAYDDAQFEFGKTYLYTVRSAVAVDGNALESDPSDPTVVAATDTFPPSSPQDVVAAITSPTDGSAEVDLSWSINSEPDLAGYRVYRSEQENTPGQLMTPDLLLSPAYRDTSVRLDHHYWYRVTAVDRTGNESVPSAPVLADVAQHSS